MTVTVQQKSYPIWVWLVWCVFLIVPGVMAVVGLILVWVGNPNGWFLVMPLVAICVGVWTYDLWMEPPRKNCPTCDGTGKVPK